MELLEIFFKYLSSFSKKLSKDFDVIILNLLRRVFMNKRGQEVRYINPDDLLHLRNYFKNNKKISNSFIDKYRSKCWPKNLRSF